MSRPDLCGSRDIIESCRVHNQSTGCDTQAQILDLKESDIDDLCDLQARVFAAIQNPALYYPETRERLLQSIEQRGLTIAAYVEGRMIAFRSVFYPGEDASNLGRDIGMADPHQLRRVAHLQRTCVAPEFRGNKLQVRMTGYAIERIRQAGTARYLFSTVAPGNYASIGDKFSNDMSIVRLLRKYETFYRYVFFADISAPLTIDPATTTPIGAMDIDAQCARLASDALYVGHNQSRSQGGNVIHYARALRRFP